MIFAYLFLAFSLSVSFYCFPFSLSSSFFLSTYFTFPSSTSRPSAGSSFFLPILLPHPSLLFIFLIIILILLLLLQLLLLLFFLAINLVFILFIRLLLLLLLIFTLLSFHFFLCLVIFFPFYSRPAHFSAAADRLLQQHHRRQNTDIWRQLSRKLGCVQKKIHKHYPYGSTPTLSNR